MLILKHICYEGVVNYYVTKSYEIPCKMSANHLSGSDGN